MAGDSFTFSPRSPTTLKTSNGKTLSLSLSKRRKLDTSESNDDAEASSIQGYLGSFSKSLESQASSSSSPNSNLPKPIVIEDDDDLEDFPAIDESPEFWDQIQADLDLTSDKGKGKQVVKKDTVIEEQMESLSVSAPIKVSTPVPTKRKLVGEDVFVESCVKDWQGSRIKAWEGRYLNPEGYYYRFVVPGEGQQNGGWSKHEHGLFMARYNEWMSKGWKIGASWGLFSKGIPHRVGYQCMNYYRKLVSENKIKDDSYAMVDGKLKQVHKERAPPGDIPTTELGPEWQTEEVKQVEQDVDRWLKEYHKRSGMAATKPVASAPKKAAPRVAKTTATSKRNISDLVKKMPPRPFVWDNDDDVFMETAEPERANLNARKIDWEKDWYERLDAYRKFMEPFLDPIARHAYWVAKQEWRRGLFTTEMLLMKRPTKTAALEETKTVATAPAKQSLLSKFFTGVKSLKVDTPDELISNIRIPNDLYSGVHQVTPMALAPVPDDDQVHYYELDEMMDCVGVLEALLGERQPGMSPLEGILVDPPWEFYIKDGRNDGRCTWNIKHVMDLLAKIVEHMTAGLVFMWTHKLLQADVVRMMEALDCKYVENLVWFKKSINNDMLDQPSPYISSTKEILLMFKKGDGFELRHQRSPDVIIDFELPPQQWIAHEFTEPKPQAVYDMIETLLPKAGYSDELKRGRLLELWAKRASPRREGWIAFHQRKHIECT